MGMMQQVGHIVAGAARKAPFERGRWRLGSIAYKMVGVPANGTDGRTIETRHGFQMHLDLQQFVDRTIFCTGEWEPLETALFQRILRPGDRFVDVGANIGYFSLLAAGLVGPSGEVTAIEANRRTFALLEANIRLNRLAQVDARLIAAGEAAGFATIVNREPGNAGADSVDFAGQGADIVPVERLDALLDDAPIRLIKIDVEGAEAKVLYGARGLLEGSGAPDLIFEFTPAFMAGQGDSAGELLPYLLSLGYRLSRVTNAGLVAIDLARLPAGQLYLYASKSPIEA